jgi:hypothetical protein
MFINPFGNWGFPMVKHCIGQNYPLLQLKPIPQKSQAQYPGCPDSDVWVKPDPLSYALLSEMGDYVRRSALTETGDLMEKFLREVKP